MKILTNIIPINHNYFEKKCNFSKTLILEHKNIKCYYDNKNMETNQEDFISFWRKIITCGNTIKNDPNISIYNEMTIYFIET